MKKVRMEVCKVQRYRLPGYPSKVRAMDCQRLLASTPTRWKGSPVLCAALALMVSAGMSGCAKQSGGRVRLFARGDGIVRVYVGEGWVGMIQPPAFLSEQEARQIIREEAEARGVHFGAEGTKTLSGYFPMTEFQLDSPGISEGETWQGDLVLDGYDAEKGVGFEYISKTDIEQWSKTNVRADDKTSSVYDFSGAGLLLSRSIREQMDEDWGRIGILYDPGTVYVKTDGAALSEEEYQQIQREFKIENLRLQVRDFLDWLAVQGII